MQYSGAEFYLLISFIGICYEQTQRLWEDICIMQYSGHETSVLSTNKT